MVADMVLVWFRSLKFPHYPRFFSARPSPWLIKTLLWTGLILVITANVYARWRFPLKPSFLQNLRSPTVTSHIKLAQEYWSQGLVAATKQELTLADELWSSWAANEVNKDVLGAVSSPLELLSSWEAEPKRLAQELDFWKNVVTQKPDYRDAYITAAAAAYQLYRLAEARQLLETAFRLDPYFGPTRELAAEAASERR